MNRIKERLRNLDADHMHELQLGGTDDMSALTMLDQGVNRSVGSQIRHQISQIPDGTKIIRVIEKGIGQ